MSEFSSDMGLNQAEHKPNTWASPLNVCRLLLSLACLFCSASLTAQDVIAIGDPPDQPEAVGVSILEVLPETRHLAASLSDRDSRQETLMTVLAVSRLLDYGFAPDENRLDALEARFREERSWLDRLAVRYPEAVLRSSLLDPSSWYLQQQLNQQELEPGSSSSPLGPDTLELVRQLFDRSNERLAAALLPEVLQRMEPQSTTLWEELRYTASVDEYMATLTLRLNADWFDPWVAAEPPAPASDEGADALIMSSVEQLKAIAFGMTITGPQDDLLLKRLRFRLFSELPMLGLDEARDAEYLLVLASALDGLAAENYLAFTESLLWVAASLLLAEKPTEAPAPGEVAEAAVRQPIELLPLPEEASSLSTESAVVAEGTTGEEQLPAEEEFIERPYRSPLPQALAEVLPAISSTFSASFSEVDSRINANLAAVFDVVQYLRANASEQHRLMALRAGIADAIAQFVLLLPDMSYYFDQPVRQDISEQIDGCISIVARSNAQGFGSLSREEFDDCLDRLVEMAGSILGRAELAGDPDGPFEPEQLRRELMMAPWQRINFALGYLHDRFPSDCDFPDDPLPNPIEWANLAVVVSWLARQSPVYFQTPENEERVSELLRQGNELQSLIAQQVDCIASSGNAISDPVVRGMTDYRESLNKLVAGLREAELEFRASVLKPGADVVLHGDARQSTAFRSEGLSIGPCNPQRACGVSTELEASRALIGQFPDTYLIADQTGLGEIEICYDNIQWVERRSEPVRADDPHVANYYGRLSFELIGRYHENEESYEVFGSRFVSPAEYHYLFGAATQEVLDDSCPSEWVGTRIVTELHSDSSFHVVPNRLTYLAASRSRPAELVGRNWSRNEEWRDSFITGNNITAGDYAADDSIEERVNRRLDELYQAEQSALYSALLNPPTRRRNKADTLFDLTEDINIRKALLRAYMELFYPGVMLESDEIRGSLQGHSALLDRPVLRRFRGANVAVADLNKLGITRLERFRADWGRQPELLRRSGSVASSVAHAMARLNALYQAYFALPLPAAGNAEPITSVSAPND